MFDHAAFRQTATQLRDFADGYAVMGLNAYEAASWANHGFMPNETAPWLRAGYCASEASTHANAFRSPEQARKRDNR
jgi:hypothetical protein